MTSPGPAQPATSLALGGLWISSWSPTALRGLGGAGPADAAHARDRRRIDRALQSDERSLGRGTAV
eukprot:974561-Pyramimonas_sp.AAC.1